MKVKMHDVQLEGIIIHYINGFFIERAATPRFLRIEVRDDFNIHGTKYFYNAVFHQKSKNYDVVSLLFLWWAKKPVLSMKY